MSHVTHQPGLFPESDRQKQNKKWQREDFQLEEQLSSCNLVLFPLALLLGRQQMNWFNESEKSIKKLFPVIGHKKANECARALRKGRVFIGQPIYHLCGLWGVVDKKSIDILSEFIKKEAENIYCEPLRPKRGSISPIDLIAILWSGYEQIAQRFLSVREIFEVLAQAGELKMSNRASSETTFLKLSFSKIGRYILNGALDQHWYKENLTEIKKLIPFDLLTHHNSKATCEVFIKILAATSMNSEIRTNAQLAVKAFAHFCVGKRDHTFYHIQKGRYVTTRYKGFMPMMVDQLDYIEMHGHLSGRKVKNFANAMLGDSNAIVCDIWIMRAFDVDVQYRFKDTDRLKSRGAPKFLYDAMEKYIQKLASFTEYEPRELCAMTWSGIRQNANRRISGTRYLPYLEKHIFRGDLFTTSVSIHSRSITIGG